MNAETITIECEDNGFHIVIDSPQWSDPLAFRIDDPEALYDHVKAAIGPWLYERDAALRELRHGDGRAVFACNPDESGGYDTSDPKHPDYHSIHADIWDARDGK